MGRKANFLLKKKEKMKFAALVAAASAAPTDPQQWFIDQWWKQAVSVFDFANKDWASFSAAVNSVDDAKFQPLWSFCNENGDANLSVGELTSCGKRSAEYMGMNDQNQNFLYDFAGKYWDVIDQDNSGSLSYDEYKYTFAGFAATDAGTVMAAFDSDSNGQLDAGELTAWKQTVEQMMEAWGWNPSASMNACFEDAWSSADRDGDQGSANRMELAEFTLGTWNCMLQ